MSLATTFQVAREAASAALSHSSWAGPSRAASVTGAKAAADPAVAADHVALAARLEALGVAQAEVDRLYARWAELEGKAGG